MQDAHSPPLFHISRLNKITKSACETGNSSLEGLPEGHRQRMDQPLKEESFSERKERLA